MNIEVPANEEQLRQEDYRLQVPCKFGKEPLGS